ncbi:hypothetical protein [Thalassotalea crassostreae]|uniref:hypothetical protein n=1 Tax=Thalassotalea crassostreae TaxID=1763536 RepID=UPI000838632B|nr:hypothetical protein [Thalassotalea crassostreae]
MTAMKNYSIKHQIKNNLIAIISIFIAVISLSYNTWRNEQTEFNRNVRTASFEVLMSLAELQQVVDNSYYGDSAEKGDPIKGWSYVIYIQDLSVSVSPNAQSNAKHLHSTWQDNWHLMKSDEQAVDNITSAIKNQRQIVLKALQNLN